MHIPVLFKEVLSLLDPRTGQNFVDGTFGGGGHAVAILERTKPNGQLWAFDRDTDAVDRATSLGERVHAIHDSFGNITASKYAIGDVPIHGILFDLGFSSIQLDNEQRGFSFQSSGPLDMRLDRTAGMTAATIVNTWSADDLAKIFREYGEERFPGRIAKAIVTERKTAPFATTDQLTRCIQAVVPRTGKINPATQVFQALRIAVNDELNELRRGLTGALTLLTQGGRLAIISFHSLEDRIVKQAFRDAARVCVCSPAALRCTCARTPRFKLITKKPVVATSEEIMNNPRSRSAKLRVIERL